MPGVEFAKLGRPLPEVLRMQLQKLPAPEEETDDGGGISEEELDAKYKAALERMKDQSGEWLQKREDDVRALKDDLSDGDQWGKDVIPE